MKIRSIGTWLLVFVLLFPVSFLLIAEAFGPLICFLLGVRRFEGQCGYLMVFAVSPVLSLLVSAYFATHIVRNKSRNS
jgi:hypothetical protein